MAPSEIAGYVMALRRGDGDAFAALLARYQNRLFRYLLRWAHEPAAAEDLFQQTWMRVIENIGRFDPERNFDSWLFAVARNIAIDHLRRNRPYCLQDSEANGDSRLEHIATDSTGALEEVLRSERAGHVQLVLQAQPPLLREVLSLRFEEEMKLEEIAEVLSVPLGTVKSRLARALERLRASFLRLHPEETGHE